MVTKQAFYAVTAVLITLLIITATLTAYYYQQASSFNSQAKNYQNELQNEINKYNQLVSNFNSLSSNFTSLRDVLSYYNQIVSEFKAVAQQYSLLSRSYNETINLLSLAVSNMNTSLPVYQRLSTELNMLWNSYLALTKNYTQELAAFQAVISTIREKLSYLNVTVSLTAPQILKPSVYSTNVLFDFGNGTKVWYNNTVVQPGWNLYLVTLLISKGNLKSTWYPQYNAHFVTGIFGIENTDNSAWFLWTWNSTSKWQMAQVGADQLIVYNDSVFAWTFCSYNPVTYSPNCTP